METAASPERRRTLCRGLRFSASDGMPRRDRISPMRFMLSFACFASPSPATRIGVAADVSGGLGGARDCARMPAVSPEGSLDHLCLDQREVRALPRRRLQVAASRISSVTYVALPPAELDARMRRDAGTPRGAQTSCGVPRWTCRSRPCRTGWRSRIARRKQRSLPAWAKWKDQLYATTYEPVVLVVQPPLRAAERGADDAAPADRRTRRGARTGTRAS